MHAKAKSYIRKVNHMIEQVEHYLGVKLYLDKFEIVGEYKYGATVEARIRHTDTDRMSDVGLVRFSLHWEEKSEVYIRLNFLNVPLLNEKVLIDKARFATDANVKFKY